jgi:phospholipid/cholesterol/gamma-HCH transport system substrate-binding protein
MESKYVFPKDSSLKILTSGLLGEQYIGIEAGASDKNMASGDVIKQTQSAVVLENLISQFLYSKAADSNTPAATTQATPVTTPATTSATKSAPGSNDKK